MLGGGVVLLALAVIAVVRCACMTWRSARVGPCSEERKLCLRSRSRWMICNDPCHLDTPCGRCVGWVLLQPFVAQSWVGCGDSGLRFCCCRDLTWFLSSPVSVRVGCALGCGRVLGLLACPARAHGDGAGSVLGCRAVVWSMRVGGEVAFGARARVCPSCASDESLRCSRWAAYGRWAFVPLDKRRGARLVMAWSFRLRVDSGACA